MLRKGVAAVTALLIASAANAAAPLGLEIADQGYVFAGGNYVDGADGKYIAGQAYVEYQIPKNRTRPYPVVMIHGGGQTASNFLSTPDGRRGWADENVRCGGSQMPPSLGGMNSAAPGASARLESASVRRVARNGFNASAARGLNKPRLSR